MRFVACFVFLFAFAGFASTQDTNFTSGPQYLITSGDPMLLQSIATPSLSFSSPLAPPRFAENQPAPANPLSTVSPADLSQIFWGVRESTPSPSENSSEIEITSAPLPRPLPPALIDTGVTAFVTARSLALEGYGVPLGDLASYYKTHKPSSVRRFTNADIDRLPRT